MRVFNIPEENRKKRACLKASEGVTSLIPSKKDEIEKSINWNCLPNEFLHCVRVGI